MRHRLFNVSRIAVGVIISVVLLWLVIRGLDWGLVVEQLSGVSIALLLLAVSVFMFASWLRAFRWQILFVNERLSIARLFIIQNEGIGLNNVMPIRVASEITQLAVLTFRDGVRKSTALATLGMERVIDVVVSTMILGLAFFLVPEMKDFKPFVWGAIGFTFVVIAVVRVFAWSSESVPFVRRISFLFALTSAVRDLERQPLRLLGSSLVSVVYWILVGVTAWIIAEAIGLPMSPLQSTVVIMGTIFFATAVPAAPSAVGTFEWAVVYVLAIFGIDREAGFGYAVVIHAVFFLPPTIIAAIFLPREGVLSLRRGGRLVSEGEGAGTRS